jgi:hypothetical protein
VEERGAALVDDFVGRPAAVLCVRGVKKWVTVVIAGFVCSDVAASLRMRVPGAGAMHVRTGLPPWTKPARGLRPPRP